MICVFREVSYSNYLFSTKIINTIYEKWVEEEPKHQPQLQERTWANYAGDCWRWWWDLEMVGGGRYVYEAASQDIINEWRSGDLYSVEERGVGALNLWRIQITNQLTQQCCSVQAQSPIWTVSLRKWNIPLSNLSSPDWLKSGPGLLQLISYEIIGQQ